MKVLIKIVTNNKINLKIAIIIDQTTIKIIEIIHKTVKITKTKIKAVKTIIIIKIKAVVISIKQILIITTTIRTLLERKKT